MRKKVPVMADVACFCGCFYSFDGGVGACSQCGEYVSLRTGPEFKDTGQEIDLHFLARLVDRDSVMRR